MRTEKESFGAAVCYDKEDDFGLAALEWMLTAINMYEESWHRLRRLKIFQRAQSTEKFKYFTGMSKSFAEEFSNLEISVQHVHEPSALGPRP